ncbi:hypothetical protein ES703_52969 [subsurface metagenome]
MDNGKIGFFYLASFELFGNFPLGGVVFCNDHNTGSIPVEPMYDAGAKIAKAA